jgi:7,8-dihydro-6-hydroxymethylpterin-pyrophosphokinase
MALPDPDLPFRPHIAIPLAELDSDHRHPVSGESLGSIAERLRPRAVLTPRPEVTLQMRIAAGLAADGGG